MATQEDYSQGIRDWFTNRSGYQSTYPLDYSHTNEDLNDWYNDWGRFGLANPLTPGGASTYRPNDVQWDQIQDFFNQRGIDNNRLSIANVFKDFNLMPDSVAKTLSEEQTPAVENKLPNWDDLNNADFLSNRYKFWLNRDVGQEGLDYWGKELEGGMSRADVNEAIGKSYETKNYLQNVRDINKDYRDKGLDASSSEIRSAAREMTPLGSNTTTDSITPTTPTTETTETPASTPTSGGGGGYSGPSLDDFKSMLLEFFDSPWTPVGYGWGGTNADAVRINRSQGSRSGRSYGGNKSSFNRSGSRLNSGTPWMNTLGM